MSSVKILPQASADEIENIDAYLRTSPARFWDGIKQVMQQRFTISGYTTTYNCVTQEYPFQQCIKSMLEFCDEVCIVDGGSTDQTFDDLVFLAYPQVDIATLEDLRFASCLSSEFEFPNEFGHSKPINRDPKIRVKIIRRDWSHPRHAVFDGMQKAEARKMCTGDFCWQMDADEVVHQSDAKKIHELADKFPPNVNILALPVIEFWGGPRRIRMDVNPAKWRLSRNLPNITHGIPKNLRRQDENGDTYSLEGSDGCDMIDASTYEVLPHTSFYPPEADNIRRIALQGNEQARAEYEKWFNQVINKVPSVFHYSWFNIERKIRLYKNYWQSHWESLYKPSVGVGSTYEKASQMVDRIHTLKRDEEIANNMFFNCPWLEVTDEMIVDKAKQLAIETGGHIFHTKWTGQNTPSMICTRSQPKWMMTQ